MREFKFRVWWKDTKRFLDGDEWYMTCSGAKHLHYAVRPYNDDDFVIEQYTGLKDQNDKEIYEGDIVKMPEWQARPRYMNVEYHKAGFDPFQEGCLECWSADGEEVEVVGNIHENPELIKGVEE